MLCLSVDFGMSTCALAKVFCSSSATVSYWLCRKGKKAARIPPANDTKAMQARHRLLISIADATQKVKDDRGNVVTEVPRWPSLAAMQSELAKRGHKVSKMTVCTDLASLGYNNRVRPRVPDTSEADSLRRVVFATPLLRKPMSWFRRLIITDEKLFSSNDFGCRTMYVKEGRKALRRENKRWPRCRVMVWGAIGVGFRHLVIYPELEPQDPDEPRKKRLYAVTATRYIRRCLAPIATRLQAENRILQEDGGGAHESELYCKSKGIERLEDWPARSPQISPIEYVWALIQKRVSEKHHPVTRSQMIAALRIEWEAMSVAEVDAFVLKFKPFLQDCVARNGAV